MYMAEHRMQDQEDSERKRPLHLHASLSCAGAAVFLAPSAAEEWSLLADTHERFISGLKRHFCTGHWQERCGRGPQHSAADGRGGRGGAAATAAAAPAMAISRSMPSSVYRTRPVRCIRRNEAAWRARMRAPRIAAKVTPDARTPFRDAANIPANWQNFAIAPGAAEGNFRPP